MTPANNTPFPSLASLRAAHAELLRRQRAGEPDLGVALREFVGRGRATGALLADEEDRWDAQNLLDYWSTRLAEAPPSDLADYDPSLAPELPDDLCPYVGLNTFYESQQRFFFGRQRFVDHLVSRLQAERLVAILGSSGSGKSSAVRAGLLPALKQGALPGSDTWLYLDPIVPGSDPLRSLARLTHPEALEVGMRAYQARGDTLTDWAAACPGAPIVLVIDQFEEIFTLCTDEEARQKFADNLLALITHAPLEHRLILTMRFDFEPQVSRLTEFYARFQAAVVHIPALGVQDLRDAIERPANLVGLKIDGEVVEALLRDILGEEAALPLLQFTLLKLWENRERNRITGEVYRTLGGAHQALALTADELYQRLLPEEQFTLRRILLKLVKPGEGSEVTSNRIVRVSLYRHGEARQRIDSVLGKLVRAGLLRLTRGETQADEQIEVTHEALIRNWPRLAGWLDEERVALRERQRLTSAANQWQRMGRDTSVLWRGLLLEKARQYDDLSPAESEFLEASHASEEQADREREAARQRELEDAHRIAEQIEARRQATARQAEEAEQAAGKMRQRAGQLTIAGVIAVIAATVAIFFSLQMTRNAAVIQAANTQAVTQRLAAEAASTEAVVQKVTAESAGTQAVVQQATAEAASTLAELQRATAVQSVAIANANRATAEAASTVAVAQQATAQVARDEANVEAEIALVRQLALQALAFGNSRLDLALLLSLEANDRASALSEDDDSLMEVRETLTQTLRLNPNLVRYYQSHTTSATSVALSPDGTILAAGGADGSVRFWMVNTGQVIDASPAKHNGRVNAITFSPDGARLASGGAEGKIMLWDVTTGQPAGDPLEGHTGGVTALAFRPDGEILASAERNRDNSIRLWDIKTGKLIGDPLRSISPWGINALAFTPTGTHLVAGADAEAGLFAFDTLYVWNVANRDRSPFLEEPLLGELEVIYALALKFDRNQNLILATGIRNDIRLWSLVVNKPIGETPLSGHQGPVTGLAFSPGSDDYLLASASDDGTVRLWEALQKDELRLFRGHAGAVSGVVFSPDGNYLFSSSVDRAVIQWSIEARTARDLSGMSLADLKAHACFIAGRNLTQAEWKQHLPDVPYRRTCPEWPEGK